VDRDGEYGFNYGCKPKRAKPNLVSRPTTFGTAHSLSRPVLRACLSGGREKLPVNFASSARFGEGDSNTASHHVWQIQPDGPLSEIAEGCEGFG